MKWCEAYENYICFCLRAVKNMLYFSLQLVLQMFCLLFCSNPISLDSVTDKGKCHTSAMYLYKNKT